MLFRWKDFFTPMSREAFGISARPDATLDLVALSCDELKAKALVYRNENGDWIYPENPDEEAPWVAFLVERDRRLGITFAHLRTRRQFDTEVARCATNLAPEPSGRLSSVCAKIAQNAEQNQPVIQRLANVAEDKRSFGDTTNARRKSMSWAQSLADIEVRFERGDKPTVTSLASAWGMSAGAVSRRLDRMEHRDKSIKTDRNGKVRQILWVRQRHSRKEAA